MTPGEIAREVVKDVGGKSGLLSKEDMVKAYRKCLYDLTIAKITPEDSPRIVRSKTLTAEMLAEVAGNMFESEWEMHYVLWRSYLSQR